MIYLMICGYVLFEKNDYKVCEERLILFIVLCLRIGMCGRNLIL